ncbi:MAG TPA: oxidoreductase [Sphingomicrobium sp.]|nr:oxidoreductase [Sphingomicrobium sp.]
MPDIARAGSYLFGDRRVKRMGYGAMQLAGPGVFGPPRDREEAIAVLREAVASGVDHIDTSDYYGPYVTNEIIREALYPYPDGLVIVTKLGARRTDDKAWIPALTPDELRAGLEGNLERLGIGAMYAVNLRCMGSGHGPTEGSMKTQLEALAKLREEGLIRHIGISNATRRQVEEALSIVPILGVQNHYNLVHREDDQMIDWLLQKGIAYVPFFPLGGFTPIQSKELSEIAGAMQSTPMQVALAWLLQRSPNILLIPGTSTRAHLRENLAAAELELPPEVFPRLDAICEQATEPA